MGIGKEAKEKILWFRKQWSKYYKEGNGMSY